MGVAPPTAHATFPLFHGTTAMRYAILVYETPAELAAREDPTRAGPYWAAYTAYSQALGAAGVAAALGGLGSAVLSRRSGPPRRRATVIPLRRR